jgi:hypothetical protein
MKAANDNGFLPAGAPTHEVEAGTIDSLLIPLAVKPHPITEFLDTHVPHLYPILLQGGLAKLAEDFETLVREQALDQEKLTHIDDMLSDIMFRQNGPATSECLEALMPYFANKQVAAETYYWHHLLSAMIAERVSMLAEGTIDGFGGYEHEEPGADYQRFSELAANAQYLEQMLTGYGVGMHQAKQIIRTFDNATHEAMDAFTGAAHARG